MIFLIIVVYKTGGFKILDPGSATPVQVGVLRAILSILDFLDHPNDNKSNLFMSDVF